ncbi:MAG: PTS glucose transporter subunit IIA [Clostridia bacterium]|nr:PTS glucose transporter subunit IIA [Clostridia bacterium]
MRPSQSSQILFSPVSGRILPLSDLPDPAFAEGMLGDGVALDPADGRFYSPCSGKVVGVADTLHAYNILADDGPELLLHIGIDTVELKGRGFTPHVKEGDPVEVGDLLAEVDLALLREGGYSTLTPLIITNPEAVDKLDKLQGQVEGGKDAVIQYQVRKEKV